MAINLCKINVYDIIMIETNIDGINCHSVDILINNYKRSASVVILTGDAMVSRRLNNSKKKHISDIIMKPYDNLDILNLLKKYLIENKKEK